MTDGNKPWETEPDSLDFEAEGLPCAMLRNHFGVWCGYVGVSHEHPLFGLPINFLIKLPSSWFAGRRLDQGTGPIDLFTHVLKRGPEDVWPLSIAFYVHGGLSYGDDRVPFREPDGRWWFGFDCGHGGDYVPSFFGGREKSLNEQIASLPEEARDIMRRAMIPSGVYRDQPYVVGECQSLAAQLNAFAKVIEGTTMKGKA